jgi:hypothetical protein
MRLGSTVSAAVTNRRVLDPMEGNIALLAGAGLAGLAVLAFLFPRGVAYPLAVLAAWVAGALIFRGTGLVRQARRRKPASIAIPTGDDRTQPVDGQTRTPPADDAQTSSIHRT